MRTFLARETEWLQELDGIELAAFWPRAFAFVFDAVVAIVVLLFSLIPIGLAIVGVQRLRGVAMEHLDVKVDPHEEWGRIVLFTVAPVLYFGLSTWLGQGRSPGKRLFRIRVVSLVHRRLSLWHSIERSLGYAASALELGFGFGQFFIHPYRRTVHDRIAETIVVKESSYRAFQERRDHPLDPEGADEAEEGFAAEDDPQSSKITSST